MAKHDLDPANNHHEHLNPREEVYGGTKGGAIFFGWLIAIAMSVLLAGIIGAVATAVGTSLELTEAQAEDNAGTIGIASGLVILILLMVGYFAGGYVAGRMARFNGGRQGIGVWVLGLIITIVVVVVGAAFGSQYNIFDRVNLPSMPIPTDSATTGGIVLLAAVLIGTVVTAFLGGLLGQRYHTKIDRTPANGI